MIVGLNHCSNVSQIQQKYPKNKHLLVLLAASQAGLPATARPDCS